MVLSMDSLSDKPKSRAPFPPFRRRQDARDYEYLMDGDQYCLTPGEDISTISTFRVLLQRITANRGLRYRTMVVDGKLWVEVFRDAPGDLFTDPLEAATAPPEPWPGQ